MKKISWGKVLPVFGAGLLITGILAFANSSPSSAHRQHGDDSTKYVLSLTETQEEEAAAAEAQDAGDENGAPTTAIELNSYSFLNKPEGTEEPSATVAGNNLHFQADSGKASPMLFNKVNTGEVIPQATLVVKEGKHGGHDKDAMTFNMTNLVVTSYQNSASQNEGDDDAQDVVVMSYETLEISNTGDGDKALKEAWDFKNNKEIEM